MSYDVKIRYQPQDKDDPRPWRASVYESGGLDRHAVGETPWAALFEVARYWQSLQRKPATLNTPEDR